MGVERMSELLTWMRSNPTTMLISSVDREAIAREVLLETALQLGDALESWLLIEQLRANEGATIEICCSNPDFNGQPNEVVVITDDWTAWKPRRFGADTLLEALRAAKTVRDIETRETNAHGR